MDWLMTLRPTWFSTIFGVYYFAGSAIAIFAVLAILVWRLQARDILTHTITVEHRHDIGKLLFGFVFFWGYIAFSQFLLIWYASIPEEVQWYAVRQIDPTMTGHITGDCPIVHFPLDYSVPWASCRGLSVVNKGILAGWGIYMLVMHWFDLYYIVAPKTAEYLENWSLNPASTVVYFGTLLGVGCLYVAALLYIASGNWLVPVRDPRLAESLAFENH